MLELPCAHTIDAHIGLAWEQFLHHLTAGAAWHAGSSGCIAMGIDAAHGQFNRLFALADRREKGDSLCADAQSITGIIHIATVDHTAVISPHCSPPRGSLSRGNGHVRRLGELAPVKTQRGSRQES